MPTIPELLQANLHRVFGERDAARRRAAIDDVYSEDVVFTDPEGSVTGRDALAAKAEALLAGAPDTFFVTLDPKWSPDSLPALAAASCGARPYCKFMAWPAKTGAPTTAAITPAEIETMAFSYLRDHANGYDKALWNCDTFKRADASQCMKRAPVAAKPAIVVPAPIAVKAIPDGLAGVRRKGEPAAVSTPIIPAGR